MSTADIRGLSPAALLAAWAAVPEPERFVFLTEALTEQAAEQLLRAQLAAQARAADERRPKPPAHPRQRSR